jgi:hypothetical protein
MEWRMRLPSAQLLLALASTNAPLRQDRPSFPFARGPAAAPVAASRAFPRPRSRAPRAEIGRSRAARVNGDSCSAALFGRWPDILSNGRTTPPTAYSARTS